MKVGNFEALYITYAPRVRLFILSVLKNEQDADDITQDIFIRIWYKRKFLSSVKNISAYIFKMTKNAVFDYLEHQSVDERYKTIVKNSYNIFSDDPHEIISTDELALLIQVTIDKMPDRRKEIFILSRFHGLTYKEIAQKLGISPKTVENQIALALAELKKLIVVLLIFVKEV